MDDENRLKEGVLVGNVINQGIIMNHRKSSSKPPGGGGYLVLGTPEGAY